MRVFILLLSLCMALTVSGQRLSIRVQQPRGFKLTDTRFWEGDTLRTYDIVFEYDKAYVRPQSYAFLDSLSRFLEQNDSLHLEIQAHDGTNQREYYGSCLSCKRANSIIDYLADRGVDHFRLWGKGYGGEKPLYKTDVSGKAARQKAIYRNRRIVLKIVAIERE